MNVRKVGNDTRQRGNIIIGVMVASVILVLTLVTMQLSASSINVMDKDKAVSLLDSQGYWVFAGAPYTIPGDLNARVDSTYNVGTSSLKWKDGYFSGLLNAKTGRSSTYVVATSDASTIEKAQADTVLTGTDDYVLLQSVLNGLASNDSICIIGNTVNMGTTGVTINHTQFTFDAENVMINYSGTGNCILVNSALTWPGLQNVIVKANVSAIGAAQGSSTSTAVKVDGLFNYVLKLNVYNFYSGTGLEIASNLASDRVSELGNIWYLCRDTKTGVKITGDYSSAYNHFYEFDYIATADLANSVALDVTANTFNWQSTLIDNLFILINTNSAVSGIKGNNIRNAFITYAKVDGISGKGQNFTLLDGCTTDTLIIQRLNVYSLHASAKIRGTEGVTPYIQNYTKDDVWVNGGADIYSSNQILSSPRYIVGGMNAVNVGSGNAYVFGQDISTNTGLTANSSGLNNVGISVDYLQYCNWNKRYDLVFGVLRYNNDAESIGRVQVKAVNTIGALADHGIGVQVTNYTLIGETYGASGRATTGTLVVMNNSQVYDIAVRYYPASRVEFYVDGVLAGTVTDTTKIPSTGKSTYLVTSINNGVTGGVDDQMIVFSPIFNKIR